MRAVRNTEDGVRVVDIDDPSGPGVVVEVASSSICGTDLDLVAAGLTGFTIGHEFAGLVDGVPYAVDPSISCGACDQCRAGHTQRCVGTHSNLGIFVDGGLCDRVIVPSANLVPLSPELPLEDACLVEPAGVAWHGARRAAIVPGERVVVVGGGSIGLLAVAVVRHLGHDIALIARHPHQVEAGERLGAQRPVGEYDVVLEATGSESGLSTSAQLARPGGRVVILGVFAEAAPIPGAVTLMKELSWIGAMAY
ncbi:MAG TPA: alcohol dehydrogenase catalytic domain-containing protein, partial [Acidimicrobiales bacterium]|nr:alcohol dehydrogenase catalytic domain-containing protein [Acidimicrobiales bacterium]